MSLTDIMSHSGLVVYAEIALVIFISIFAAVLAHVAKRTDASAWDQAKSLPLEGDEHATAERR